MIYLNGDTATRTERLGLAIRMQGGVSRYQGLGSEMAACVIPSEQSTRSLPRTIITFYLHMHKC